MCHFLANRHALCAEDIVNVYFCLLLYFKACPEGRYGSQCLMQCNCENGATCNPVNGQCNCSAGWTGQTCNQRKSIVAQQNIIQYQHLV